jgi:DNA-binding NarL/FixJ family response regulator
VEHDAQVSEPPSPPRTLQEEILAGDPLTEREIEVLAGVAAGESARETGKRLYLSPETVKGYRKRLIAKLAARNGANAVLIGIHKGLIR